MRFTAEEKQILAMCYGGSVSETFCRLSIVYDDVCEFDKDPLLEDTIYSAMVKLMHIDDRELRKAVREAERPVGIWQ